MIKRIVKWLLLTLALELGFLVTLALLFALVIFLCSVNIYLMYGLIFFMMAGVMALFIIADH